MISSLLNHEQVGVSEQAERHSYWSKDSPDPISYKKRDRSVSVFRPAPALAEALEIINSVRFISKINEYQQHINRAFDS